MSPSRTVHVLLSLTAAAAAVGAGGCRRDIDDDGEQLGAAVGEVLASLDETSQDGLLAALMPLPAPRTPAALRGPAWRRALDLLLPAAYAGACLETRFTSCEAGVRTRTFDRCSVGAATLDGTVSLAFSSSPACVFLAPGQAVTRTADFTLTGLYGGTLRVTSPGGGQTLTRTASGFTYDVRGMQRVLKGPAGRTLADVVTSTPTPLTITGSSRADLTITGGTLEVEHRVAGYRVDFTPKDLAWSAHCTCAVSGSLTGTVSGGKHDGKTATVTLQGCGEAALELGGQTVDVTLDRCASF